MTYRMYRKVKVINQLDNIEKTRLDTSAQSLPKGAFTEVILNFKKLKRLWVAVLKVEISRLKQK